MPIDNAHADTNNKLMLSQRYSPTRHSVFEPSMHLRSGEQSAMEG